MSNLISTMSPSFQSLLTVKYEPAEAPSRALPFTFTSVFSLHAGMRAKSASGNVRVVYLYTVDDEATEWQSEEAQVIGAELELYDMEGDLVCRWVSDGKELDQSQTYRLHAASVPEGYRKPLRDRIFTPDDSDVKRPRNLVYLRKAN